MGDHEAVPKTGISLSNHAYDIVRWLAQIFLPAASSLYYGISLLVPLPAVMEVVGITALVITFLGALMNRSKAAYDNRPDRYDGVLIPQPDGEGNVVTRLALNPALTAEEVLAKKDLTFKGLDPSQAEAVRLGSLTNGVDPV